MAHDLGLAIRRREVEVDRDEALPRRRLEVLRETLVAGVVRDHELEVRVRLDPLAGLLERQDAPVVGQRMDRDDRVLARLDDLVEVAERPGTSGDREGTVLPDGLSAAHQVAAGEIVRREVVVTRDGDDRPAEAPRHVADEARLAAAGRALQQHREPVGVGGLEQPHLVPRRPVVRLRIRPIRLDAQFPRFHRTPPRTRNRRRPRGLGYARLCERDRRRTIRRNRRTPRQSRGREVPDERRESGREDDTGREPHQVVDLDHPLGLEVSEAEDPLEVGLRDASGRQRHRHAEHAADHQPECPQAEATLGLLLAAPGESRQRIADDREVDHRVGAEERHVTVHRRHVGPVRPLIHLGPRVGEPEDARSDRREDGRADRPVQRDRVRMRQAAASQHVVGVHRHREQRERLERGEESPDEEPVAGHADPVVVVPGPEDAGQEGQPHDDVEPLLHDLAIRSGEPDQQVREHGRQDQHPDALDPQVHDPPAVVPVERVVVEVDQRGDEEQRRRREAADQHGLRRRPALRFADRHRDVEQEQAHHDDHAELQRKRHLQQLPAFGDPEQVADDGRYADRQPETELHVGESRAVEFRAGFLGHDVVGGAHEPGEAPDQQQIGVDRFRRREVHDAEEGIRPEVLGEAEQSECGLQREQQHGGQEVGIGDSLGVEGHRGSPRAYCSVSR